MSSEKPRLARLTSILTQLQSRRLVTAQELATRHDVSIRTIYRDIRTLEQSGVPIITEEGKGYSMMEGYRIPPVMFTEQEANALITAEQLISRNKDQSLVEEYRSAITKIKSVLQQNQKSKTELLEQRIQVRNNAAFESTSSHLIQLQSAIADFKVMKLSYQSLGQEESERHIEPFALYTTKENWVLIAYCRLRNDFRSFRLDGIQRLRPTGEVFEPHQLTLEQYLENCRKKYSNP